MTSPSGWWELSGDLVRKACGVRAALAARALLTWLNEAVDACAQLPTEQEYSLRCIFPALRQAKPNDDSTKDWFLQLMARTQVAFKETEDESAKLYLCDVFMLSVIVFSGIWTFEPDIEVLIRSRACRQALLPAAAATLLAREPWTHCTLQMLEWLSHTRTATSDASMAQCCQRALLALRHTEHFTTHKIWIRLESHFAVTDASNSDD
ncbi:unnamed protein product [Parnassius apollo]|uniref:(apollo) hypothetical protein n=1 Tax=Parnassius apollo TaxID=110799 RepID=A0A8S3XB74_PARAO|nr:unnamed protein product [Parnassius apollo]